MLGPYDDTQCLDPHNPLTGHRCVRPNGHSGEHSDVNGSRWINTTAAELRELTPPGGNREAVTVEPEQSGEFGRNATWDVVRSVDNSTWPSVYPRDEAYREYVRRVTAGEQLLSPDEFAAVPIVNSSTGRLLRAQNAILRQRVEALEAAVVQVRSLTRYDFAPAMKGLWLPWELVEMALSLVDGGTTPIAECAVDAGAQRSTPTRGSESS